MNAVANIFDMNSDGFIDYYEFVSALHPSRDPYRRTLDADQINEEVSGSVCAQDTHTLFESLEWFIYCDTVLVILLPCLGESTGVAV